MYLFMRLGRCGDSHLLILWKIYQLRLAVTGDRRMSHLVYLPPHRLCLQGSSYRTRSTLLSLPTKLMRLALINRDVQGKLDGLLVVGGIFTSNPSEIVGAHPTRDFGGGSSAHKQNKANFVVCARVCAYSTYSS